MGTSYTGEVSSDRLTSYPGGGENHLSATCHGNRRLTATLWALWPKKDKLLLNFLDDKLILDSLLATFIAIGNAAASDFALISIAPLGI